MGSFVKQQSSITVYRLPIEENKLSVPFRLQQTQTAFCRFHFLFAGNKKKLPFSVSSVFRLQ
jgi:hypothetical protein